MINIREFLTLKKEIPLIDVRSPSEFKQGHIPGAINIPLFNDDERATIGKLYKHSGQKEAILTGLDIAGKKIRVLAESAIKSAANKKLIVHCWRGGMRSSTMAWLFETCGIQCNVLTGGYKSYRNYIREFFCLPFNFLVLGGMTGSGKSAILDELEGMSFQVLKLEEISHHKGSVFGNLGESPQSTNEQFENDLFNVLSQFDIKEPIFVEDESRNIGQNIIPPELFYKMSNSRLIVIEMDKELRISRLVKDYGKFANQELIMCIEKISKRLGGRNTQSAISSIEDGRPEDAVSIILYYYDKTYHYGLSQKKNSEIIKIILSGTEAKINTVKILEVLRNKNII